LAFLACLIVVLCRRHQRRRKVVELSSESTVQLMSQRRGQSSSTDMLDPASGRLRKVGISQGPNSMSDVTSMHSDNFDVPVFLPGNHDGHTKDEIESTVL
jgi:hypothetical protein